MVLMVVSVGVWAALLVGVAGHGRLVDPPSRSSAWRYGFNTPANYNDHELYCGGFSRQWQRNKGKCGPCGDAWDSPKPRDNEEGGKYGLGVIVAKYRQGQVVEIGVELTANHKGFFEFRLCPNNNPKKPVTNACLDLNVLQLADGSGHRYYPGPGSKKFPVKYRLPPDITCTQCVLQWRYVCGNNWGTCENGTGAVGCGAQEEFRACADIVITTDDGSADDTPANTVDETPTYTTDENENEVDVLSKPPTQDDTKVGQTVTENHIGHYVALTVGGLFAFFVLLLLLGYFYGGGRTALKTLMNRASNLKEPKTPRHPHPAISPSKPISSMERPWVNPWQFSSSSPIGNNPPVVPPRTRRSSRCRLGDSEHTQVVSTISVPSNVTVNGVSIHVQNSLRN